MKKITEYIPNFIAFSLNGFKINNLLSREILPGFDAFVAWLLNIDSLFSVIYLSII